MCVETGTVINGQPLARTLTRVKYLEVERARDDDNHTDTRVVTGRDGNSFDRICVLVCAFIFIAHIIVYFKSDKTNCFFFFGTSHTSIKNKKQN